MVAWTTPTTRVAALARRRRPWASGDKGADDAEDQPREHGAGGAFVPPHELVAARARRCSEERAAFSVCVGNGRTLKGRDLRDVRTAVLRMTGFLET